jgi:hypothetical protein
MELIGLIFLFVGLATFWHVLNRIAVASEATVKITLAIAVASEATATMAGAVYANMTPEAKAKADAYLKGLRK